MAEGSGEAIRADDEVVSAAEVRELKRQVRELQRVLGKKTMENEILREAVKVAHEKTDIAVAVAATGRFAVKTVADTLGVARSNLVERAKPDRSLRSSYRKPDDSRILLLIRELVDARPTCGYRRITALLNRRLVVAGEARVNHKRIYRIMQLHGMLLERHTGRRIGRAHDGTVRTLRSNTRWCSDGFEIACWNGDTVCVAFVLDTCDREAVTWTATTAGISGEMIRDLLLVAVERRFAAYEAPQRIEFLADNGSCYTAHETIEFALSLGLMPRFTPVRSPESNGMAESFVKRLSEITSAAMRALTPRPSCAKSALGSKTTTTPTRIERSRCSRLGNSSPLHHLLRVRSDGATPLGKGRTSNGG
jgi:transposase InsO family protein